MPLPGEIAPSLAELADPPAPLPEWQTRLKPDPLDVMAAIDAGGEVPVYADQVRRRPDPLAVMRQLDVEEEQENLRYALPSEIALPVVGNVRTGLEGAIPYVQPLVAAGRQAGTGIQSLLHRIGGQDDLADELSRRQDAMAEASAGAVRDAGVWNPDLARDVEGAASSLLQTTATPGGAATKLLTAGALSANKALTEGKAAGLTPGANAAQALAMGAFEALPGLVLNRLGGTTIDKALTQPLKDSLRRGLARGVADAADRVATIYGTELGEELITAAGQQLTRKLSGIDPGAFDPATLEQVGRDVIVQTALMTGATAGITEGANAAAAVPRMVGDARDRSAQRKELEQAIEVEAAVRTGMEQQERQPLAAPAEPQPRRLVDAIAALEAEDEQRRDGQQARNVRDRAVAGPALAQQADDASGTMELPEPAGERTAELQARVRSLEQQLAEINQEPAKPTPQQEVSDGKVQQGQGETQAPLIADAPRAQTVTAPSPTPAAPAAEPPAVAGGGVSAPAGGEAAPRSIRALLASKKVSPQNVAMIMKSGTFAEVIETGRSGKVPKGIAETIQASFKRMASEAADRSQADPQLLAEFDSLTPQTQHTIGVHLMSGNAYQAMRSQQTDGMVRAPSPAPQTRQDGQDAAATADRGREGGGPVSDEPRGPGVAGRGQEPVAAPGAGAGAPAPGGARAATQGGSDAQRAAGGGVGGSETSIEVPGAQPVRARYEVRELDDLQPSHRMVGGAPTPNRSYPAGLQPRDYKPGNDEHLKVVRQAAEFRPAYTISDHPDATSGPSVVTRDGTVINGNSRVMTLQALDDAKAAEYRRLLESKAQYFGIDPASFAGMRRPVLVRTVDMDPAGPDAVRFARQGNVSTTQTQSPVRTAASLGGMINEELLDSLKLDDDTTFSEAVTGPAGARFRSQLLAELAPTLRSQYLDENTGNMSEAGKELVRNILLSKAIQDVSIIEAMTQERADLLRSVEGAVPQLLKMKGMSGGQELHQALVEAMAWLAQRPTVRNQADVNVLVDAGGKQIQSNLFAEGDASLSPEARMVLGFLLRERGRPRTFKRGLVEAIGALDNKVNSFLASTMGEPVDLVAAALQVPPAPGATFQGQPKAAEAAPAPAPVETPAAVEQPAQEATPAEEPAPEAPAPSPERELRKAIATRLRAAGRPGMGPNILVVKAGVVEAVGGETGAAAAFDPVTGLVVIAEGSSAQAAADALAKVDTTGANLDGKTVDVDGQAMPASEIAADYAAQLKQLDRIRSCLQA